MDIVRQGKECTGTILSFFSLVVNAFLVKAMAFKNNLKTSFSTDCRIFHNTVHLYRTVNAFGGHFIPKACPDSHFRDGGEVVSLTHRPRSTHQKLIFCSGTHFC
jgi:hypothetical protein